MSTWKAFVGKNLNLRFFCVWSFLKGFFSLKLKFISFYLRKWWKKFCQVERISFLELKRIKCCPLPYNLLGPVLTLRRGTKSRVCVRVNGWDGWDGSEDISKWFFNFFILRYITLYFIYKYLKKLCRQISCGFEILVKLGSCPNDFCFQ